MLSAWDWCKLDPVRFWMTILLGLIQGIVVVFLNGGSLDFAQQKAEVFAHSWVSWTKRGLGWEGSQSFGSFHNNPQHWLQLPTIPSTGC